MIVPMRHVTLLCVAAERERTLSRLRELGAVHLEFAAGDSAPFREAQARLDACRHARHILDDVRAGRPVAVFVDSQRNRDSRPNIDALLAEPLPALSGAAEKLIAAVLHLAELRQIFADEAARLDAVIARYQPFGEFDADLPGRLGASGLPVRLFRAPLDVAPAAGADGLFAATVGTDERYVYGVAVGGGALPEGAEDLGLPEAPVSALQDRRARVSGQTERIVACLKGAGAVTASLDAEILRRTDARDFAAACETMQSSGAVAWIAGWVPAESVEALRASAAENAWGLLMREPEDVDTPPPTLLRPPRLFRPMLALFESLGISPAYNESDVSVPFFCFFSVFFAMLVGDGGYGALILAMTGIARRKYPAAPRAPFVLLTVFALATVGWGALSNTWFGTHPAFLNNGASLWLNDPEKGINNTMWVCFTLGVAHLSVARVWNVISLFPDSRCLAQAGWLGIVWFMYCMSCGIVGIFDPPRFMYAVFVVSVLLVFVFTFKRSELKEHGLELGIMPLNIVSCLGDVISYVRLFAVGLASVKVAENFNDMAIHNGLPVWLKIVPLIAILLVGHGLNFLMAGLSILVHAVRLNTLEFSNHKGITWSGYPFRPFRQKGGAA